MLDINNSNDRYELFVEGDTNDADYINHTSIMNIDKMPEEVYIELVRLLYTFSKNKTLREQYYSIRDDFMCVDDTDDDIVDMKMVEKYAPKLIDYEETIKNYCGCPDHSLGVCLYYFYEQYIPIDSEYSAYVHTIEKVELYKIQDKICYQYDFEVDEWKKKIQFFD